jgi:hypothetical protein
MALFDLVSSVENSAALDAFRESLFVFPAVEGIHLLGLSVAVGLLALVDLRLAGWLLTGQSVADVVKGLRPWFIGGFVAVIGSGIVLFFAKATIYSNSPLFWTKLVLIFLAGINAVYFEWSFHRQAAAHDSPAGGAVLQARVSGLLSLGFWITIIILGRLLAYFQANGAS